jgi:spore germination protein KC
MKQKMIIFLFMPFIFVGLTGCWSATELDELGIAGAIGIDKVDDQYKVSVQVLNPSEIAAQTRTTRTTVSTYSITGETIFEALRKMTTKAPRKTYVSHVRVVVFGEELAKDGIKNVLDFLSRDYEFRTDFYIIVAKGETAENVLKVLTPVENIPPNKMYSSLEISERYWAPTKGVNLDELISNIISDGKNPVLTGISILGDPEEGNSIDNVQRVASPTTLQYTGIAAFKEDKLVGWLNMDESKGFNNITDNVTDTVFGVSCGDGQAVLEVIRSRTKVTGKMEGGIPKIKIDLTSEANIGEVTCGLDITKKESIIELQKKAEAYFKENIEIAINKAKEDFGSDIFGFGEAIHRGDPKSWKSVKDNWDETFKNVSVDIMVNVDIRRTGTVIGAFEKGKKE